MTEGWEEAYVADVGDVPVGGMKAVEATGRQFVVFNLTGEFHAYVDQCPHQGARMSCGSISGAMIQAGPDEEPVYGLEGRVIVCPRHRWKFLIETGESLYGIDRRRLPPVPIRVDGERLLIGVRRVRAPAASTP